ncbi:MAG: hypothetical protein IK118_05295 [Clostridia bacterium]|nr:hypothetical protein [Clostridia bacterium]MBR5427743.1 hypothetical protein [Clostridia bacterium]
MQTVNEILAAVASTLFETFGFEIFRQPAEQGFSTPCFFLSADDLREKRLIGGRLLESFTVRIEYLPPDEGQRRENALELSRRLFRLFDSVETPNGAYRCYEKKADFGAIARGYSRGFEVTDELLRFTFKIQYFTLGGDGGEEEAAMMERLIMKGETL